MHKPKGHVCGRSDPEGRPHLGVYLPAGSEDLRHIGRLDFNTTGLLLWANHPGLQRWLLAPQHHIPKTYRVKLRDLLEPDDPRLRRLSDGSLTLDGRPLQPCPVAWETHRTRATWIRIVLTEGRHRQIRRMCARVGLQIVKLERVAIASLVLPTDLTPRQIRPADADAWRALFTPWPQLADLAEPFARGALSLPAFDRVLSATDAAPEGLARAIP